MRRVLLAGGMSVSALMGASVGAYAQERPGQPPSNNAIPQPINEPRDITNQDIVDKAELDAVAEKRAAKKQKGARPATQADIVAGSEIRDNKGVPIGTVDRLDADGVVVATTSGRVKVPLESFGKDSKGLVFAISKAEFDQILAASTGTPAG